MICQPLFRTLPQGNTSFCAGRGLAKNSLKGWSTLINSIALPSPPQPQPLVLRRILSSTLLGENGEDVDRRGALIRDHNKKRQILRDQNRKIFHPPPIEGIDIGVTEGLETLDPEIRIPIDEDFVLPPPLESLIDKAKTAYKFLPKQGDIDRLIAKIKKGAKRYKLVCRSERSKSGLFDKPTF